MTQSFDVFFVLRLNKRLGKQSRCRWFKISSCSLWHHSNTKSINKSLEFKKYISCVSERGIRFNGLTWDGGHRGPYKPCNHNLYIGIISVAHFADKVRSQSIPKVWRATPIFHMYLCPSVFTEPFGILDWQIWLKTQSWCCEIYA